MLSWWKGGRACEVAEVVKRRPSSGSTVLVQTASWKSSASVSERQEAERLSDASVKPRGTLQRRSTMGKMPPQTLGEEADPMLMLGR